MSERAQGVRLVGAFCGELAFGITIGENVHRINERT